jgi:parallel beta-helix repeat protein
MFRFTFYLHSTLIVILVYSLSILNFSCSGPNVEVKVTAFGAVPGDGKDDTPSILAALENCKGKKNVILTFEIGLYDIFGSQKDEEGNFRPSIQVHGMDHLTIDGHGAELIGHDLSKMFDFSECSNILVTNLTTDWNPLPFTQGRVVKTDTAFIDMEVMAPFTARSGRPTEAILGYDIVNHRMARRLTDHYQLGYDKKSEVVSPGVMRLFIGRQDRFAGKLPSVGDYLIVRHQVYEFQSFEFNKCNNVVVENVNIYSNPGMGVTGEECRNITLKHLNVMLRPGSGRWMSCTADATHFAGCRGIIRIENCLFEGMGDDATNVRSGHYLLVSERLDDNRLRIKPGYRYGNDLTPPQIGDKIELSGKENPLLPYRTLTVRFVGKVEKENSIVIGFSEKLPQRTKPGDIAGNASSCPVLRIRNCTTIRNRSRGFIVKTRDVVIEDCTFQDITECGIALESDIDAWWESISARDVIIRNNRFIDSKSEPGYLHGVIESHTMSQNAPAGVYRRIIIANNIFLGSAGNMIKLGSADSVNIVNNIMDSPEDEAIFLYNSKNILITGNKLTNSFAGLKTGPGCDTATIGIKNNFGF